MEMSGESLQDCLLPLSRKRPYPALGPEVSNEDSEDLLCRPYAQKVPKLSNRSEDEPTLESTHRSLDRRNVAHCEAEAILDFGDNARSSKRDQTQAISETSEYETLLQSIDSTLI